MQAGLKTENVFLIMTDGLRWQEVFTGAETDLMTRVNGGCGQHKRPPGKILAREIRVARREALLPFLWNRIGVQGQIFGNQNKGSVVKVTNGKNFSYPGYNEIITGAADPRIDSNNKVPNPTLACSNG
jgi:hypothetical protein